MNLQPSASPSLASPSADTAAPSPHSRFELLDVDALHDPCSGRIVHLYALVARCLSCEAIFKAQEGEGLVSTSAARVLRCPTGCGEQAFRGSALRHWHLQAVTAQ